MAPGDSVKVQVILLGLTEEPTEDFKCRDKFLVITLPAPYDLGGKSVAEAWPELETEFKQKAISKKIKVKFLIESEPLVNDQQEETQLPEAEPQQEQKSQLPQHDSVTIVKEGHPDHVPESVQTVDQSRGIVDDEKTSKPLKQTSAVESEKPIKSAGSTTAAAAPATKSEPVSAQEGALNSTALILIAIIALVLGWLYY